jgi:hypothetical protein
MKFTKKSLKNKVDCTKDDPSCSSLSCTIAIVATLCPNFCGNAACLSELNNFVMYSRHSPVDPELLVGEGKILIPY